MENLWPGYTILILLGVRASPSQAPCGDTTACTPGLRVRSLSGAKIKGCNPRTFSLSVSRGKHSPFLFLVFFCLL